MAAKVVMPQAGQDLETGVLVRWLRAEGDLVARGDPIAEVETEKVTVEVPAPVSGVVLRILVSEGAEVPILSTIAVIGDPGEDVSALV